MKIVAKGTLLAILAGCAGDHVIGFDMPEDGGSLEDAAPPTPPLGDPADAPDPSNPCLVTIANPSSKGCDYFIHPPLAFNQGCYAIYLVNDWTDPIAVTAEAQGTPIDVTSSLYIPSGTGSTLAFTPAPGGKIPVGQVGILFAWDNAPGTRFACPAGVTAIPRSAHPEWTDPIDHRGQNAAMTNMEGFAMHLRTSAPVVAYDIMPFGGGKSEVTSASLLLPTSSWDTNYVLVTPYKSLSAIWNPAAAIVAADDTDVTILPSVDLAGNTGVIGSHPAISIPPAPAGKPWTFHLARGQVMRLEEYAEITGTILQSTKPVGVWAEQICITIGDYRACDAVHQQIPPVRALGNEYAAVRYRNRFDGKEESVPWRLVGAVDGTTLVYDPAPPANAPATLARGQAVTFDAPGPFVVRSQDASHPFYMNVYMPSAAWALANAGFALPTVTGWTTEPARGDPEYVNVIPPAQFDTSYVFYTDPTYPETNLVVVRAKDASGAFADVTLDCAGTLGGWQPLGDFEYTRIDLMRHAFLPQNGCTNGRHEAKSTAPFGITVWGWGTEESRTPAWNADHAWADPGYSEWVSYAYPAGAHLRPLSAVVVQPR